MIKSRLISILQKLDNDDFTDIFLRIEVGEFEIVVGLNSVVPYGNKIDLEGKTTDNELDELIAALTFYQ